MLKKVISAALAIAVVLSCITIVPVSAAAYDAVTVLYETAFDDAGTLAANNANTVAENDYGTITYYNGGWRLKSRAFGGNTGIAMANNYWAVDFLEWAQTTAIADGKVAIEFDMAISNDGGVLGTQKDSNDNSTVSVNGNKFLEFRTTAAIHGPYYDAASDTWYVDENNSVAPQDDVIYKMGLYMDLDNNKLYTSINGRNLYTNNLPENFEFSTFKVYASKTFQYFDNLKITYYPASADTLAMTAPASMYASTNAVTVDFAEPVPANLTTANFTATVDGEEAVITDVEKLSAYQARVYFESLTKGTYTITPVGITGISGAATAEAPVTVAVAKAVIFDEDYQDLPVREDAMYRAFGEWNNTTGNFHIAQDENDNIALVNSAKQDEWQYTLPITLTKGMGSLKVSFDAKMTLQETAANYIRLWFARSNNSGQHQYLFTLLQNSDGSCVVDGKSEWATGGTTYTVDAAGEDYTMHSYELIVDMNAMKTNIIIDGVLKEQKDLPANAELKKLVFDTRAGIAQLDNFQVIAIDSNNAGFANDAEVANGASQVVLKVNTAVDTAAITTDNFTFMQGGAEIEVTDVAFDATNRYATLTLAQPCAYGYGYTVTITGITTLSGITAVDKTVNVVCQPDVQVVSKTLGEDGVVTVVIKNNTASPIDVTLIGAVYNNADIAPDLVDFDTYEGKQVESGKTITLYTKALDISSGGNVKAYVWNDLGQLNPLTDVITF